MKKKPNILLIIVHILSWIIFAGLCFEAGVFIFNTFFRLFVSPENVKYFWQEVDLSALYQYDKGYFYLIAICMSIAAILKAIIFYLIIKILYNKKLSLSQPFTKGAERFIYKVACLSLLIGLIASWGVKYSAWMVKNGVKMPDAEQLRIGGPDVWIFMGVTLLVVAQIFKKGIEIQSENELTV